MFGIGTGELIVILFIALLLFGANRLPELGKSIGKTLKAFKEGMKEIENDKGTNSKKDK
jgi:sec-independent protein translocase protein TatA